MISAACPMQCKDRCKEGAWLVVESNGREEGVRRQASLGVMQGDCCRVEMFGGGSGDAVLE